MANHLTLTIYGRHVEYDVRFPARWMICPSCEGNATTTRHIECVGGGFTASEWAEACDDDPGDCDEPGFAQKYFSGAYDRPCPDCSGLGRVLTIDEDTTLDWRQRIFLKAHRAQEEDRYASQRESYYERRMGC